MRLFPTDAGYGKALENQDKGFIRIRNHAKVLAGNLRYDRKDWEIEEELGLEGDRSVHNLLKRQRRKAAKGAPKFRGRKPAKKL